MGNLAIIIHPRNTHELLVFPNTLIWLLKLLPREILVQLEQSGAKRWMPPGTVARANVSANLRSKKQADHRIFCHDFFLSLVCTVDGVPKFNLCRPSHQTPLNHYRLKKLSWDKAHLRVRVDEHLARRTCAI